MEDENGDPLVLPNVEIRAQINGQKAKALVDSACQSVIISSSFARQHKIPLIPLVKSRQLKLADGIPVSRMFYKALVDVTIGDGEEKHVEQILAFVGDVEYDIMLGLPWLSVHQPQTRWSEGTLVMDSLHCALSCNTSFRPTVAVAEQHHQRRAKIDAWEEKYKRKKQSHEDDDVHEVTAVSAVALAQREGYEVFTVWLQEIGSNTAPPVQASATSAADFEKFMKGKDEQQDPREKLPPEYHDLADAFSRQKAKELPPHRPGVDLAIQLKEGSQPPFKRYYPLDALSDKALKKWIDDLLEQKAIRKSISSCSAPVIVVKKPGGGLRICIDYRALNALTVKNRYPIPRIKETLTRIANKKYFTKLDIIAAFNRVRIQEGHEWLTAFSTRYGQYECLVMPFGLSNAPAAFQSFINDTLMDCLDDFASAYLDDCLIFSDTLEEHVEHVRKVIKRLHDNSLTIDIDKCEFHVQETKFLGLIVTTEGIKMDDTKVKAILDWEECKTIKDVQSFLGFANFYRTFIFGFSKIAAPLTALTKKNEHGNQVFRWEEPQRKAFQDLKEAFMKEPILAYFEPGRETIVETDASDDVLGAVCSQKHEVDGKTIWKTVAYFSKKMSAPQRNYDIYDKELLAIVEAFDEYRPELTACDEETPIGVITDHKGLEWFMSTKKLNSRQARWAEGLSGYNFVITYRPGKKNIRADALSRRSQDRANSELLKQREQRILDPEKVVDLPAGYESVYASAITTRSARAKELPSGGQLMLLQGGSEDPEVLKKIVAESTFQSAESSEDKQPLQETSFLEESGSFANPDPVPNPDPVGDDRVQEAQSSKEDHKVNSDPQGSNPDPSNLEPDPEVGENDVAEAKESFAKRLTLARESDEDYQETVSLLKEGVKTPSAYMQKMKINPALCAVGEGGQILVEGRQWLPNDGALRLEVIRRCHSAPAAGHPGTAGTLELVRRQYYWPHMAKQIRKFVRACRKCRMSKHSTQAKQGLLHPMPIPEGEPWSEIAVDFVVGLPESKSFEGVGYANILTVTCRLTKMARFLPIRSMTAPNVARIFLRDVWSLYGLPTKVTSDRGPQFVSSFMKELERQLDIGTRLSSSYHPETDGQSERTNQSMERYLRSYVNENQNDWVDWLPMAEFAHNNQVSASTGVTPFYSNLGRHPRMDAIVKEKTSRSDQPSKVKLEAERARDFAGQLSTLHQQLRQSLALAQCDQADAANTKRRVQNTYSVGDKVFVSTKNLPTTRPSKSLDFKYAGPFEIISAVSPETYKLDLPSQWTIDNAFHVALLQPALEGLPGQHSTESPPPPVIVQRDDRTEEEYEVEAVVDSRQKKAPGRIAKGAMRKIWTEYKVRWKGYEGDKDEYTWEHEDQLAGSPELVAEYHRLHPEKSIQGFTDPSSSAASMQKTEVQLLRPSDDVTAQLLAGLPAACQQTPELSPAARPQVSQPRGRALPSSGAGARAPDCKMEDWDMEDDHAFAAAAVLYSGCKGLQHGFGKG